jgi:hypothetical protein
MIRHDTTTHKVRGPSVANVTRSVLVPRAETPRHPLVTPLHLHAVCSWHKLEICSGSPVPVPRGGPETSASLARSTHCLVRAFLLLRRRRLLLLLLLLLLWSELTHRGHVAACITRCATNLWHSPCNCRPDRCRACLAPPPPCRAHPAIIPGAPRYADQEAEHIELDGAPARRAMGADQDGVCDRSDVVLYDVRGALGGGTAERRRQGSKQRRESAERAHKIE